MNREILFRGKTIRGTHRDRETGEWLGVGTWVEGFFVNCKSMYDHSETDRIPEIVEYNADRQYTGEYSSLEVHEVDPETVGQYTGLVDKNGVKIFEGDIISGDEEMCSITHCTNTGQTNTVKWTNKDLRYVARCTPSSLMLIQSRCKKFEVIGNIWDNPELLEVK